MPDREPGIYWDLRWNKPIKWDDKGWWQIGLDIRLTGDEGPAEGDVGHRVTAVIDAILFCPACGLQHVDAPEPDKGWTNPPHKTHACHGCGHCGGRR